MLTLDRLTWKFMDVAHKNVPDKTEGRDEPQKVLFRWGRKKEKEEKDDERIEKKKIETPKLEEMRRKKERKKIVEEHLAFRNGNVRGYKIIASYSVLRLGGKTSSNIF